MYNSNATLDSSSINVPLWIMLSLRHNCYKRRTGNLMRLYSYCYIIAIYLFAIYSFLAILIWMDKVNDIKLNMGLLLNIVSSLMLHCSMLFQRRNLRILILFIKAHLRLSWDNAERNYKHLVNCIFLIVCTLPFLFATIVTCCIFTQGTGYLLWSFGYKFQDERYKIIVQFTGECIHYIVIMQNPLLSTASLCILIQNYGLILLEFNDNLKNVDVNTISSKSMEIAKYYVKIEDKIYLLKDAISKSLFVILLNSFLNLHLSLSSVLQFKISIFLIMGVVCTTFTGSIMIFSLTYFSSNIPNYMLKIKKTIGSLIDNLQFNHLYQKKETVVFRRIEKKEIIYLSAGGIFPLKMSFLFTAIGTIFTYGMIIINLK